MLRKKCQGLWVVSGWGALVFFAAGCGAGAGPVNTYVQGCEVSGSSTTASNQRTLAVNGVISTMTVTFYGNPALAVTDTTCSTTPVGTLVTVSKNDLVGPLPTPPNPNGVPVLALNLTEISSTWTVTNAALATLYNSSLAAGLPLCGITMWAANVPQNVANTNCGGAIMPPVGGQTFGVIEYAGNNLFLYDVNLVSLQAAAAGVPNGTTAALRINSLELNPEPPASGGVLMPYVLQ